MTGGSLPTRWVACVDGTWCNPDGAHGRRYGNISNIYRICASIKVGECQDMVSGIKFNQRKRYYAGIGSEKDIAWLRRIESGAFGRSPQIEAWLVYYIVFVPRHQPDKLGYVQQSLSDLTKKAPIIQLVGVLDTVKALSDGSLYDIIFNDSTQHARHALAVNEDRKVFKPKIYYPEIDLSTLDDRSIVEAWFVGVHIDIGGSAPKDGLALYPLQWMLSESRSKGLLLEFDGTFDNRAKIDDPLKVCFPCSKSKSRVPDSSTFTLGNGLRIEMSDLRPVHEYSTYETRYSVRLNESQQKLMKLMRRDRRQPFSTDGELKGYCKQAPQGTIMHPSVFFLHDEYSHIFVDSKIARLRYLVEGFRSQVLSEDVTMFWNRDTTIEKFDRGPSSNSSSEPALPGHDVGTPFVCKDRPDLAIHDSGGFESGGDGEFNQVKDFIRGMSSATEMKDRLHMIWFCTEANSPRIQQRAAVDLFMTVSENSGIPIIVILTKKDEMWDLKHGKALREGRSYVQAAAFADEELEKRTTEIEEDRLDSKGSRCDAMLSVSTDDKRSIRMLVEETARCFDHAKFRMLYVAAQVASIRLKVDLANDMANNIKIPDFFEPVETVGTSGIWVFLPSGKYNNQLAVTASVEHLLIVSCDLILILQRAFKDCARQGLGQPVKKNIEEAALAYQKDAPEVHDRIRSRTPAFKMYRKFRYVEIRASLEQIIEDYTRSFVEQSGAASSRHNPAQDSLTSGISTMDLNKAQRKS
ncbi:MAG: hypothetical protein Q9220_004072 [cf. Caloplaca sp. 1 TL-2023]